MQGSLDRRANGRAHLIAKTLPHSKFLLLSVSETSDLTTESVVYASIHLATEIESALVFASTCFWCQKPHTHDVVVQS